MKQAATWETKVSGIVEKNFTPLIICSPADSNLTFIPDVINFVLDHSFISQRATYHKAVGKRRRKWSEKQLLNLFFAQKLFRWYLYLFFTDGLSWTLNINYFGELFFKTVLLDENRHVSLMVETFWHSKNSMFPSVKQKTAYRPCDGKQTIGVNTFGTDRAPTPPELR